MKKLFSIIAIVSFSMATIFAQELTEANPNAPEFKWVEETHDFGTIPQSVPVTNKFYFENVGKEPLIVSNVQKTCGCTVTDWTKEPVMPGVLQVEALAQTGGILVLASVPDPENYSTYFIKMDKVKFKKKVVPGDTMIFKIELITPIRRGIVHMQGYGYVGDSVVVEAELMAQVAKNKTE